MDTLVKKTDQKPSIMRILSAVMFFAVAVLQLVSLIFDLSMSYRDTMRWGGVSAVMLFCTFAVVILLCGAAAAIIYLQKDFKLLGTVLKIYAGTELMFCIYSLIKDLGIYSDASVWMFIVETLLFVLALIAFCALISIKGVEKSPIKYVLAIATPVLILLSVLFAALRDTTYVDSRFAAPAVLYAAPIMLAVAFALIGFSEIFAKGSDS